MVRFPLPLVVVVSAAFFLAGCGKPQTPQAQVRGTVTLDNQPLHEGNIVFLTPGKAPETLPIKAGAFEGRVGTGARRVEIVAYTDAPPLPPLEGMPSEPGKMNYLPAKYNTQSTLRAEVTSQGANEFAFELTSS